MPDAPDAPTVQYLLPDLGEGMSEAEVLRWTVAVGDHVARDQIVVHVQTDKAEVELPVPAAGTITALGAAEGDMVPVVTAAADALAASRGATVGVVDLRTISPLDVETLVRVTEASGRVVVVHEAPLTAGAGAEVVATIQEQAFWSLQAPVARVAGYDVPAPAALVEDWVRPDVARVVAAVQGVLDA